ncbi:hypothetical protein, partial [Vibrio maritimus]|uniref:hypothetical protein n=1 Tax=Vibrio maritimus TaxID=990268 RepID=UPI0040680C61
AIKQAQHGQYDIVNVNHKNDIQNISPDELRQHVVIALSQGNTDLNPNNIEKIMDNFAGKEIQFVAPDNLLDDIKACIDKYERQELDDKQAFNQDAPSNAEFNNKEEAIISQHHQDQDSKALEQFEP